MSSNADYKYWAFISYSHQDKTWGDWLHKALETYAIPAGLAGSQNAHGETVPKRLFPVFRDREELPLSADLGGQIQKALRESRYLVVICSPNAAKSRWVEEEIRYFKALGREHNVLPLIVGGEPNATDKPELGLEECFPQAIRHKIDGDGQLTTERTEPIGGDVRSGKDEKENALLKLVAAMAGVNFDDLKQRDKARRKRRLAIAATLAALVFTTISGLGLFSFAQWREAKHNVGLALAEKAGRAFDEKMINEGRAYAIHSLEHLDHRSAGEMRSELQKLLLQHVGIPQERAFAVPGQLANAFLLNDEVLCAVSSGETADLARRLSLWELDTGRSLAQFDLPGDAGSPMMTALDVSRRHLAVLNGHGGLTLWDVAGRKQLGTYPGAAGTGIRFSPDGSLLAVRRGNDTLLLDVPPKENVEKYLDARIVFLGDGKRFASIRDGKSGGASAVWDTTSRQRIHILGDVALAAVSSDGGTIAFVRNDNRREVGLMNTASGTIRPAQRHEHSIVSLDFSPDGKWLASGGSTDAFVRVWDLEKGELFATFHAIHGPLYWTGTVGNDKSVGAVGFVAISPDRKAIAVRLVRGGHTLLWRFNEFLIDDPIAVGGVGVEQYNLSFSPDGKYLLDEALGTGHYGTISSMVAFRKVSDERLTPEKVLESAGSDREQAWRDLRIVHRTAGAVTLVARHEADGSALWLWNPRHGDIKLPSYGAPVRYFEFFRRGERMFSAYEDGTIRVWDVTRIGAPATITFPNDLAEAGRYGLKLERLRLIGEPVAR